MTPLQQAQDELAILQAQLAQNDTNFALETAQYNQRKDNLNSQITVQEAVVANLTPAPQ